VLGSHILLPSFPTRRSSDLHCIQAGAPPACNLHRCCAMTDAIVHALRAVNLVKTYTEGGQSVPVLRDVSLHVDRGEMVAIVGARSEEHTSELQSCENLLCRL